MGRSVLAKNRCPIALKWMMPFLVVGQKIYVSNKRPTKNCIIYRLNVQSVVSHCQLRMAIQNELGGSRTRETLAANTRKKQYHSTEEDLLTRVIMNHVGVT